MAHIVIMGAGIGGMSMAYEMREAARAEDKVAGVCVMASLVMAAVGGCWWPLEIGPPVLRLLAHCVPAGWAMDALHQLISFGGGLSDAARPIAVLAAFGLAANALAARFFKW